MKYFIADMELTYSDEFEIYPIWVTTDADFDLHQKQLLEVEEYWVNQELFFGTNEAIIFKTVIDYVDRITFSEISESTYNEMKLILEEHGAKYFTPQWILERVKEHEEDYE